MFKKMRELLDEANSLVDGDNGDSSSDEESDRSLFEEVNGLLENINKKLGQKD